MISQSCPSQCWMRVRPPCGVASETPTDQASLCETAVIPNRTFDAKPSFGLSTMRQTYGRSGRSPAAEPLFPPRECREDALRLVLIFRAAAMRTKTKAIVNGTPNCVYARFILPSPLSVAKATCEAARLMPSPSPNRPGRLGGVEYS